MSDDIVNRLRKDHRGSSPVDLGWDIVDVTTTTDKGTVFVYDTGTGLVRREKDATGTLVRQERLTEI